MDNWFTNFDLMCDLRRLRLSIVVGTLRKSKPQIPKELITNLKGPYKLLFGFNKEEVIVSYCCKKGSNVILLPSLHKDNELDDTDEQKPEIISFYNQTTGDVDKIDSLAGRYEVSWQTKCWQW